MYDGNSPGVSRAVGEKGPDMLLGIFEDCSSSFSRRPVILGIGTSELSDRIGSRSRDRAFPAEDVRDARLLQPARHALLHLADRSCRAETDKQESRGVRERGGNIYWETRHSAFVST
jgi:hypothetical protein